MRISIIIPTYNEETTLPLALQSILPQSPFEILVVDGGSTDHTVATAGDSVKILHAEKSITKQINAGGFAAQGDALLFLHADCRIEPGALAEMENALADPAVVGGAFRLALSGKRPILDRFLSFTGTWNARLTGYYLGDHGIFCRRSAFMDIRGFPEVPLMYEFDFIRKLRTKGKLVQLRSRCLASARRFEEHGYWKTMLLMRILRTLYRLGLPTSRLQHLYLR